jgi:hypothetical protein
MKYLAAMAAAACALACTATNAARLEIDWPTSANGVYSFFLHGEMTTFNGVGFSVKPVFQFLDVTSGLVAGAPRPPGDPFTYRNRLLDADPSEFLNSKQWTLLGIVNTPQEIAFSGGPLGQNIKTNTEPGGRLFLANIKLQRGGGGAAWSLQLVNGVDTVLSVQGYLLPEPAATAIAGMGLVGVMAAHRRRSAQCGSSHLPRHTSLGESST